MLATLAAVLLARRAVYPMAQALETQRRFVADAGHELRTPLTLLSTRAQLLARRVRASESASGDVADAAGVSDRDQLIGRDAEGIVADTSALTAILEEPLLAADTRTPAPADPVDVGVLVATAVAAAQAAATEAGLTLTLSSDDGDTTLPAGAPTALGRAVTALIDNALGHARTQVDVRVGRRGRTVVVEVGDDGPGISGDAAADVHPLRRSAADRRHPRCPAALRPRSGPGQRDRHPARRAGHRRQPPGAGHGGRAAARAAAPLTTGSAVPGVEVAAYSVVP